MRWRSRVMQSSLKGFAERIRHHGATFNQCRRGTLAAVVLSAVGGLSSTTNSPATLYCATKERQVLQLFRSLQKRVKGQTPVEQSFTDAGVRVSGNYAASKSQHNLRHLVWRIGAPRKTAEGLCWDLFVGLFPPAECGMNDGELRHRRSFSLRRAGADFWTRPVGNGPYRYVKHVPQTFVGGHTPFQRRMP